MSYPELHPDVKRAIREFRKAEMARLAKYKRAGLPVLTVDLNQSLPHFLRKQAF